MAPSKRNVTRAGTLAVVSVLLASGAIAWAAQVTNIPVVTTSQQKWVGSGDCNGDSKNGSLQMSGTLAVQCGFPSHGNFWGYFGVFPNDVDAAKKYLAGTRTPSTDQFLRCDVNWNGRIDQGDVDLVTKAAADKCGSSRHVPIARYKLGDVNGDTKVTSSDSLLLMKYLVNDTTALTTTRVYNADCKLDGVLNMTDALGIEKMATGSITCPQ